MKLSNVLLHLDTFNSIPESKKHQNIILNNNNIGVTLTAILSRLKDNPNIINNSSWDYSSDLKEILFTTFTNIDSATFNQILAKLVVENQNVLNETTIFNQQTVEKYEEVSLEKMKAFLSYVINDRNLGMGFHIDSSFADYQDSTGKPIFNAKEIVQFDNYVDLLFEWADGNDIDIYEIALDIIQPTIDAINAPGEENPNKDVIEKIENFLYERENETSKVFYIVSAEPSQVVPDIAEYLESCIKKDYDTSPSFIRCEIVGNVITFFELSTFEESKGKFIVDAEVNTGVFEYSPNIADHNFIEFEGYMDERAELVSGEDNWNCADLIIKLITEDSDFNENEFMVTTENGEILQLITGIQYNCVLEPKDENTFSLSFYDGNTFVGDCEITTEEVEGSLQIESIDWTITDYEEEIDIDGTLYFNDDLIQALLNFYLE